MNTQFNAGVNLHTASTEDRLQRAADALGRLIKNIFAASDRGAAIAIADKAVQDHLFTEALRK